VQYIHDNTEDELTPEVVIKLPGIQKARRASTSIRSVHASKQGDRRKSIRPAHKLMQLFVDTSFWARAIAMARKILTLETLPAGHPDAGSEPSIPAIPRTDDDANHADFLGQSSTLRASLCITRKAESSHTAAGARGQQRRVLRIDLALGVSKSRTSQTAQDRW